MARQPRHADQTNTNSEKRTIDIDLKLSDRARNSHDGAGVGVLVAPVISVMVAGIARACWKNVISYRRIRIGLFMGRLFVIGLFLIRFLLRLFSRPDAHQLGRSKCSKTLGKVHGICIPNYSDLTSLPINSYRVKTCHRYRRSKT